ncbi:MAG: hypothetical protein KDC44_14465, partial [Phaeodactylibacter sp.]|nr:hypothetical protein [Phaeodactylibacter sp.]
MRRLLVLPIFWASFLLPLVGQVRIHIKTVPANTPIGDTLFLAASFNDWNPGDRDYPFVRLPDGTYFIQLNIDSVFDYKITRGAWSSVEGGVVGEAIENRRFDPGLGHEAPQVVVQTWEDLPGRPPWANQVIRVRSIPTNTPADASIYIVGNFNRWHPADPRYELELQTDGTYQVSVPVWMDTLEYKFTRGSWKTVEGRKSGRARFNRQLIVHVPVPQPEVVVIESWEDLSGHPINIYTFLLLLAAFQGLLLIVAINTLQDYNRDANRLLSFLILLISLVLIGRVSTYDRDIFQLYPKLLLVPDLLYFLYAPVFYLYIRRLLLPEARNWNWSMLLHFLPFMLQLLVYLPLLGMEPGHFISLNTDLSLRWVFVLSGGIAFIYNLLYWWWCWRIIRNYQRQSDDEFSYGNNLQFLQTIMGLKAACLIIWAASYLIGGFGWLFAVETSRITDRSVDFLWVVFSLTVFILGYFAMRQPEIFKMPPLPP